MKIVLTSTYFYPRIGGVENSLFFMAKSLMKLGHEVAIMCFDGDSLVCQKQHWDGIPIFRFNYGVSRLSPLSRLRLAKAARRALIETQKHFEPDEIWSRNAVITAGLVKSNVLIPIRHIFPTTASLNVEGMYSQKPRAILVKLLYLLRKWIDSQSLSFYDRNVVYADNVDLVVFSEMMREQLVVETKALQNRIRVVHPGVDTKVFRPTPPVGKDGFSLSARPYVVYVGRLVAAKNLEILIKAMSHVDNVSLVLIGTGESLSKLQNLAVLLGLNERIFFLGSKKSESLATIYTGAVATVLPTRIESFGQVFLESLACGTPVIGFGGSSEFRTAVSEIVKHDFNGVVVTSYCENALADAIKVVLDTKNSLTQVSELNIKYVRTNFSWDKTVIDILANPCQ